MSLRARRVHQVGNFAKRILVHDNSNYGNSAICSSPAVSGNPNIRFMFWIA